MIHRHRLGNQRTDKDHQHGKQADPTAALHAVVWERAWRGRGGHRSVGLLSVLMLVAGHRRGFLYGHFHLDLAGFFKGQ